LKQSRDFHLALIRHESCFSVTCIA
jgi:hypothetical protein